MKRLLRLRGIGLIESVLFVVISLGLVVGGTVFFQQASEAARVNDAVQSIVSIQSGVRSLYVAEAKFGISGSSLLEAAVASGSVSPSMVQTDGSIEHQWGGDVTIIGHPNTFVVDYQDVPRSACVRLAPYSATGTGAAGNGIASIAINGVLVDDNGDGMVSPAEAEAACATAAAEPVRMKWAFLADSNMRTSAWEVEGALGIDPEETGRETEAESRQCGTGFLGNETRSRDHITLSDGSTTTTEWSGWDRAGCAAIVETSRRTETENGTCPTGMVGASTRSRDILTMSDGTEQALPWSGWDVTGCQIVEVSRYVETQNGTCPTGTVGTSTRSREVAVMSDGSEQPQSWSSWDLSQCLVVQVSQRTENQSGTCPTGYLGTATRSRIVWVMSDGTEQPQVWSGWNNAGCYIGEVSRRTDTETAACGTGYTGNQTRTQVVIVMSNGTEQPQGWSAWNRASCTAVNQIVETRTYKREVLITCGYGTGSMYIGRAVRRYTEIKDRYTNGTITSRGEVHAGDTTCVEPGNRVWTYIDQKSYSNCSTFGQQSYVLNHYRGANTYDWHVYATENIGCGYY